MLLILIVCIMKLLEMTTNRIRNRRNGGSGGGGEKENRAINGHLRNYFSEAATVKSGNFLTNIF